jgi:TolB-like protein
MTDVVISYARSTEPQAEAITAALRALGYAVWRDDDLPAHRDYSDVIEERVAAAKAVVVLWSAEAVKSQWVRAEADLARQEGKLVQLSLDPVKLPLPFNRIHCAELSGWSGDANSIGWRTVLASLGDLVGAPAVDPPPARTSPHSAEPLLAVLAFDNLSGDPEMTYFSDGISEEILQTVARGARLRVIGRGSSFQFRGRDKAASQIAATLKATHVLDGSVRRSGSKVRIAANLIECARETTIWSDRFDRELSDVFVLQDEIAAAVAAALNVVFHQARPIESIDPVAYDRFLRAVQLGTGNVLSDEAGARIIELLEDATRRAPRFASAWALLASLRAAALRYGSAQSAYDDQRAKVIEAAETALRLDPGLGAPYHPLAELEAFGHFAAREALYRKALAASPNDPHVLTAVAFFASEAGHVHEALELAQKAFELDPIQFGNAYAYASFLDFEGRFDESRGLWDAFAQQWPTSGLIARGALAAAVQARDWDRFDALVAAASPEVVDVGRLRGVIWLGSVTRDPQPERLQRALERARQEIAQSGAIALDRLTSLCSLGLVDETFELIEHASFAYMFDPRQKWASGPLTGGFIFSRGGAAALMEDVRYVELCAKLGLCDYWVATGRWPDCAQPGAVPYDFKAEARRLAKPG